MNIPENQENNIDPFMEHPSGEFDFAIDAMEDAIQRLRALPKWDQWITFCAQGQGKVVDTYAFAEIRLKEDKIDISPDSIDVSRIIEFSGVSSSALIANSEFCSISSATPKEAARILDAIFRLHFSLTPFPDEDNDYAVGVEW